MDQARNARKKQSQVWGVSPKNPVHAGVAADDEEKKKEREKKEKGKGDITGDTRSHQVHSDVIFPFAKKRFQTELRAGGRKEPEKIEKNEGKEKWK